MKYVPPIIAANEAYLDAIWRAKKRPQATAPQPSPIDDSANPLRPTTLDQVVGQESAKRLVRAAIRKAERDNAPLDHMLLTGPAGTGKSTLARCAAHELRVPVWQLSAPVSFDTLLELREVMPDRSVLFVDEIHQQAIMERRGREAITQPEVFLNVLEDRTIVTPTGPLPFPNITVIGATTDPGRLPEAFLSRFTIRPRLQAYSNSDLGVIGVRNALALGLEPTPAGAAKLAFASAGIPRRMNNLVKQAAMFGTVLDEATAQEALDASGLTADGLDADQQEMLLFLKQCALTTRSGVVYQASLASLATALGLSRDTRAITLYVEPMLVKRGLVQIAPQGRRLTDAGLERARNL